MPLFRTAIFSAAPAAAATQLIGWQAGNVGWMPAPQTLVNMADVLGVTPSRPTEAPHFPAFELVRRVRPDNVCGYVSGISASSLFCSPGLGSCVVNNFESVVGCCNSAVVSDCHIPTACADYSDSTLVTATDSYTNYCGSAVYPSCVTYVYTGEYFSGNTLFGCGATSTLVYISANAGSGTHIISASPASSSSVSFSTVSPPPISTSISTSPSNNDGSSVPLAPVVGGAIGGVALLSIIALALCLIFRRRRNVNKSSYLNSVPNPSNHMNQFGPGFGQPGKLQGAVAALPQDFRHSYAVSTASPPAQSPSPTHFSFRSHYPSGVPSMLSSDSQPFYAPMANPLQNTQPLPQPYLQSQHPAFPHTGDQHLPPSNATELSTERGDNELRELA